MEKPFSPSCERNQAVIFAKLEPLVKQFAISRVLEVASGTGQHAAYFSSRLKQLHWQTSDLEENLSGIKHWLDETGSNNTPPPIALDVQCSWPDEKYDGIFTANSLHIMSAEAVECFFHQLNQVCGDRCLLMVYGPFNRDGKFTSESNRDFDAWLQARDPLSGIRDFGWVNALANDQGFKLLEDHAMPANNNFIVWQKT